MPLVDFQCVVKFRPSFYLCHLNLHIQTEPIVLCYSYELPDTEEASISQPSDVAGAYIISRDKLWPKGKESLTVYFMNDPPDTWRYGPFNDPITKDRILDWAKIWNKNLPANVDGRECIPKFEPASSMKAADIRVQFGSGMKLAIEKHYGETCYQSI